MLKAFRKKFRQSTDQIKSQFVVDFDKFFGSSIFQAKDPSLIDTEALIFFALYTCKQKRGKITIHRKALHIARAVSSNDVVHENLLMEKI